ncbi:MAG: hypothetical protein ACRDAU_11935 [Clostridium sp.]
MDKWIKKNSKHYVFHYHKSSVGEDKINEIIELQEYCFNYITQVLKIKSDIKIKYYLCNSAEEVGFWAGDNIKCNAFAEAPNKIFAVVNNKVKCTGYHEDAHILSYLIGVPPQAFIREGLAMYFDKNHRGINNLNWVAYYIDTEQYIKISKLILDEEFCEISWNITYPIAGAFTEYIITRYGIDNYIKFYKSIDNINLNYICENVFKKNLGDLEDEFIKYIKSLKSNISLIKELYQ